MNPDGWRRIFDEEDIQLVHSPNYQRNLFVRLYTELYYYFSLCERRFLWARKASIWK